MLIWNCAYTFPFPLMLILFMMKLQISLRNWDFRFVRGKKSKEEICMEQLNIRVG